ncbi:MAG: hypothetical protein GOVbin2006_43 [Prokaryotic dsDNA virus sp.]|nr:MAG: hypothetical protein GOVbin2006_43 [Prokaryotic dsDNA virus sp.]|tara:strand:+ start:16462 stop:19317 length:2856 start_codon:yes stop_codon:yes gene_type:complete
MSIQLTLYPQYYNGYTATTGPVSLNELADANIFQTGITPGSQVTTLPFPGVPEVALNSSPANNNWSFYSSTSNGGVVFQFPFTQINLVTTPIQLLLGFYGGGVNGINVSGCYQRLTGLTIGQTYEVVLDVAVPQPHNTNFNLMFFGVNNAGMLTGIPPCGGGSAGFQLIDTTQAGMTTPVYFTAQNTTEVFNLTYASTNNPNIGSKILFINEIICRKATVIGKEDGQKIADLYNEEEIPLTLSVDTFQNASEKQQSYSKAFKLPATKHNNEIFENLFDVTRNSLNVPVFNVYRQTRAVYKEDGHVIFSGYMRLIDITYKDNEYSYNVNLYSDSVALASLMKAETMAHIDLDELSHVYNKGNIFNSWNGQLPLINPIGANSFAGNLGDTTTNVLKYPNCNWNGQIGEFLTNVDPIYISSGNTANLNQPYIARLQTMFRPFIKVKYLVQKIFQRHGFTFTSNFFDSAYFERLFVDYNWGKEINWAERGVLGRVDNSSDSGQVFGTGGGSTAVLSDNNTFLSAGYNTTTGVFTAPAGNMTYNLTATIVLKNLRTGSSFLNTQNALVMWVQTGTPTILAFTSISIPPQGIRTAVVSIPTSNTIAINSQIRVQVVITNAGSDGAELQSSSRIEGTVTGTTIIGGTLMNTERGKLKQWDFFKGLITMFNLVTLQDPNDSRNLIIEPYDDIFGEGNKSIREYDWTDKVDSKEFKLKPMDLKSKTTFQYTEDSDYPFGVYKSATNGYLYGSLEYTVPDYTQVKGETKVEAKPFAATIVKPHFASIPDWIGPQIYKANADATQFEGMANKPRILYDVTGDTGSTFNPAGNGTPMPSGVTYYIPFQNGSSGVNQDHYCIFSHVNNYPSTFADRDLNFGPCQLIGIGVPPVDNLYSRHYQNYYYELYNPNTRKMSINILLTAQDIVNFKFNDRIRIKNRVFRVSKINYKPRQLSKVELILIP